MNALYKIADGHAEAMEFVANATTRNRDTPLRELRLKPASWSPSWCTRAVS